VQPAAPATINADAPGAATPVPGGLRVTFGTGRADLNPTTEAAIRALVRGGANVTAASDTASFTITTFAPGTPEDPSTPRRLSLSRALTVRSVLISQGVASVRIYVRAFGPASLGFADGPPDRADIAIATNAVAPVAAKPN
jgi:outer membrane protein OmpA-like peptidoglycan-associated protein